MTPAIKTGDRVVDKSFPPISRHMLAIYCGASGDLNPVHVDSDAARAAGFPDVFAHGMLVMAWLGEAVTHSFDASRLRSLATRFVAITQVGASLTATGQVIDIFEEVGETRARIALRMVDERGETKLAGEAVIALED